MVRTNKIFTADKAMILYKACGISSEKYKIVIHKIISMINREELKTKGKIILLNGVSSSGKTTLTKAIQKKAVENYWMLSNDIFAATVSEKFLETDWPEAVYQSLLLMGKTAKMLSDCGENVIIDTIMRNDREYDLFKDYMYLLIGYPVCTVQVTCPVVELLRREKERNNREIGTAESQLSALCLNGQYNITVDTFNQTIEQCVDTILNFVNDKCKYTE
jgi:chloramphenicol 3-O-phosphotransferase